MGNENHKVQKDYRPPPVGVPQSQISYSQTGQVVIPNRQSSSIKNSNTLNVQKQQSKPSDKMNNSNSLNIQKQQSKPSDRMNSSKQKNNANTNVQQSTINRSNISVGKEEQRRSKILEGPPQKSQKNIKVSQSSIKFIETSMLKSQLMVSALNVRGFEGEEFKDRKIKKFNIEADIPEKDLIKESNYFDESMGDLGVRPKVPTRLADFSVGNFEQINTFPVKTYLFDRALNDKLVA